MDRPAEGWVDEAAETADGEIQRLLNASETPEHARRWLRRVAANLSVGQDAAGSNTSGSTAAPFAYEDSDEEVGDGGGEEAVWARELLRRRVGGRDAKRLLGETDRKSESE